MLDKTNQWTPPPSPWTEEKINQLKRMWGSGLTAAEISREFQGEFSRSAVIGKVHRLGLEGRPSPILTAAEIEQRRRRRNQAKYDWKQRTGYQAPRRSFTELPPTPESPPIAAPDMRPCQLLELTRETCRWPLGHPGTSDFFFCGAEPQNQGPYCAYHDRTAHVQLPGVNGRPFIPQRRRAA